MSPVGGGKAHDCWLERWSRLAIEQGTRALDVLRDGVEEAISTLGSGFLFHPANAGLRESLRSGSLTTRTSTGNSYGLSTGFIFLFVSEDRGLLLDPAASDEAKRVSPMVLYPTPQRSCRSPAGHIPLRSL